ALHLPMHLALVEHLVEHALLLGELPGQLARARGALVRAVGETIGRQRAENLAELPRFGVPVLDEQFARIHATTVSFRYTERPSYESHISMAHRLRHTHRGERFRRGLAAVPGVGGQ